ncbi:hypothetical protein G6O67_005817 [Ophiocordyceps sinensis]|uniref:Oligosaccaryltransferase n=1 Tax=Ophiocordyceps sinensis TaxID=72228 RepID=A0A8H4LX54_9HYPO|nr:hypothetical protein G6O67_005817 [Ophiocordyceps sinensis]
MFNHVQRELAQHNTSPTHKPQHFVQAPSQARSSQHVAAMISDRDLFSIAILLGGASMVLVILYHFLEDSASPVMNKAK